jgi:hypothetical protein
MGVNDTIGAMRRQIDMARQFTRSPQVMGNCLATLQLQLDKLQNSLNARPEIPDRQHGNGLAEESFQ